MVFYENKIYQNNQSQICIVAFQYPRNRCFFKRTDFPSMCFQGWRKILLFQYLYDKIHVLLYKKLVYKKLSIRTFKKNFFFQNYKGNCFLYQTWNLHNFVSKFCNQFSYKKFSHNCHNFCSLCPSKQLPVQN